MRRKPFIVVLILLSTGIAWGSSYELAEQAYKNRDFGTALGLLRSLAEKDDGRAQYSLSLMLAKGEGTSANLVNAFIWASLAVENAPDEYFRARSGILLERVEGRLTPSQKARAKEELTAKKSKMAERKANPNRIDWEVTHMTFKMGNYAEALADLKTLAQQNDQRALFFLGDIYCRGEGVGVDYAEAAKWFRQGAVQGFPDCMTAATATMSSWSKWGQGALVWGASGGSQPNCSMATAWIDSRRSSVTWRESRGSSR